VVLGTACQLQQAELWAAWLYVVIGLGMAVLRWPAARRWRAAWLLTGAMLGWGLTGVRAVVY
jgi:hypothetical protein